MIQRTTGEKVFNVFNYIILTIFALTTLYPFLYTLSISPSTQAEADRIEKDILMAGQINTHCSELLLVQFCLCS